MWKVNNTKMHGLSEIGPNVPAFLIKLWKLVNSPETDELICWSESGLSCIIKQPAQFSRELLSLYYKHNNMASFIRQLNMYGFHKVVSDGGGLKSDNLKNKNKDCMEFAHQYFIKGHPYLLENIKRKLPNPKSGTISNEQLTNLNNGSQSEILAKVLSDVNNLKKKQESWDARLAAMKRENEALWRELAIFRQKHLKQEQIINRLIQFIVTMVQPSRNVNVPLRRRYPLMLNDMQPVKKITKLSGADATNINQGSPTGPTIHEIDTADVLYGSPEQLEFPNADDEFISSDLTQPSPKFVEADNSEAPVIKKENKTAHSIESVDSIPEDWLEIQLTEDNLIDPLTPIDPAKINPAVAAATLKHLEGTNKLNTPIAITIPSVTTSTESGKKNVTEKKIIYLTGINDGNKGLKKNARKQIVLKLDTAKKKISKSKDDAGSSSGDLLLDLVPKTGESSTRSSVAGVKRKLSTSSKTVYAAKKIKKDSDEEDISTEDTSNDPFLKLQSLYNGTISEDQLALTSPECPADEITKKDNKNNSDKKKASPCDVLDVKDLTSRKENETTDDILDFDPDSMAIVCQQPGKGDNLSREFSSHVDTVQGEMDYLKEMLKGEGYSFDANNLPWLFNDDPLSYGVLPAADEDGDEKKNEELGISGNEVMTYGGPNLMDLVDLIGSTTSNQEWPNILSPTSPALTDLTTPSPSPSSFSFPTPGKRRKT